MTKCLKLRLRLQLKSWANLKTLQTAPIYCYYYYPTFKQLTVLIFEPNFLGYSKVANLMVNLYYLHIIRIFFGSYSYCFHSYTTVVTLCWALWSQPSGPLRDCVVALRRYRERLNVVANTLQPRRKQANFDEVKNNV